MQNDYSENSQRHYILNKPYGYISQLVDNSCKRNGLLGELYDFPEGIMAVGRLDKDSEGLLLLTTDGKLSNFIRSNKIEKEYYAQLDGIITEDAVEKLCSGIEYRAGGKIYTASPCTVKRIEEPPFLPERRKTIRGDEHGKTSWISITIREGKNRQVRRMTGAAGFPTLRLIRIRIGSVYLGNLPSGAVQELDNFGDEINNAYTDRMNKNY